MERLKFIIIIAIALILHGCIPPQENNNENLGTLSYDRLIKRLEVNRMRIKHFIADGNISIKSDNFDQSTNFRIMISRNDSLFMNIFGPFNLEVAQILVYKNDLKFYEALNNKLYITTTTNENIKNAFKINFDFAKIKEIFQGTVNIYDNINKKVEVFNVIDDYYFFKFINNDSTTYETYKIRIANLSIFNYQIIDRKTNKLLYNANYDNFEIINGTPIAKYINIEDFINNQKITINYKKVDINKGKFIIDFDIPEDVEIIRL
jgi:hypothetical protein